MGRILVVDDERSMREFLGICLKRAGHEVSVAASGKQALEVLSEEAFEIVISDIRMPGEIDGLKLLELVKERKLDIEVILVTAFASADTALAAMKIGAYDYLTKPFKVDEISAVIARALEKRSLVEANAALRAKVAGRNRLASMVGKGPRMQRVFEMVRKIRSSRTSVLITGESGTGKELIARALHTEGSRSEGEFVAVNCGAIPENLMESELFGHVAGAFTGATTDKLGLVRSADKGTLFLDEIGELDRNLQVKLLRVLQERKVRPVGSEKEFDVDLRVLAATNRELENEVARGAFRSDLYYRLNVIELRLPPLRQRLVDIPILAKHFLQEQVAAQGKAIEGFSAAALKQLEVYDYPGNVRELQNIIERAVSLAEGSNIDLDDLPALPEKQAGASPALSSDELPEDGIDLDRVLSDYERKIVGKAMQQSDGVRKRAAALLGISFRSLRYRLTKLGLDSDAIQSELESSAELDTQAEPESEDES